MSEPLANQNGRGSEIRTATIAKDDATGLSNIVTLLGRKILGLYVPTMDSAALSFRVCDTIDGTFLNLYDVDGNEVTIGAGTHNKAYAAPAELLGWPYMQVRSGVAGAAVTQTTAAVAVKLAVTD